MRQIDQIFSKSRNLFILDPPDEDDEEENQNSGFAGFVNPEQISGLSLAQLLQDVEAEIVPGTSHSATEE